MPFELISGSQAVAIAVQRVGVDLVAAYPITPQTAIVETLGTESLEDFCFEQNNFFWETKNISLPYCF